MSSFSEILARLDALEAVNAKPLEAYHQSRKEAYALKRNASSRGKDAARQLQTLLNADPSKVAKLIESLSGKSS